MPKTVYRRVWSDKDRADLIQKIEPLVHEGRSLASVAHQLKVSDSWYRTMKKRYLAAHPHFSPLQHAQEPTKALAVRLAPIETAFKDRPAEEKVRLFAEYDKLGQSDKEDWRKRYGISQAALSYHRMILKKKQRKPTARPINTIEPDDRVAMVREYMSISAMGGKSEWLKAHNLNHQQIHELKKKVANAQFSVNFKKKTAPAAVNGALVPSQLHMPHALVTLDDAILAMEVKRDQLCIFIDDLKRMQRGQR